MKRLFTFISTVALLLVSAAAFAFSPNGTKVNGLTVNSANVNMINDREFMIDTPTACKMRLKRNSSVSNATVTQVSLRANTINGPFAVNRSTPFLNLSGCTNGTLVRE